MTRQEIASTAGWWVALLAAYVLLVGQIGWEELLAGSVTAVFASTAAVVARRAGKIRLRAHLRWLPQFARLPWRVVGDCGLAVVAFWQRLASGRSRLGVFRAVPFDAGRHGPVSAARRALVTWGASLPPNAYVVAVDHEHGLLLVHELVDTSRRPGNGNKQWPL
ncbi:MAG TPA: hypothetical protein VHZ24_04060 [Pirellulales bacterium]|jgi:hypothetical protein|nr:hypothetical protein [Pirellulales bacterium]